VAPFWHALNILRQFLNGIGPKAPFGAPLRSWIRGELSSVVRDYLSAESLRRRGIYNQRFVAQIIREDSEGRKDHALLIWRLLCNELWLRTFFD